MRHYQSYHRQWLHFQNWLISQHLPLRSPEGRTSLEPRKSQRTFYPKQPLYLAVNLLQGNASCLAQQACIEQNPDTNKFAASVLAVQVCASIILLLAHRCAIIWVPDSDQTLMQTRNRQTVIEINKMLFRGAILQEKRRRFATQNNGSLFRRN